MKHIYFVLLLFFSVCGYCQNGTSPKDLHLFLLMGQSNMAGYGEVLPADEALMESVYMLRNSQNGYCWVEARQPIHNRLDSDRFCLAGPFAQAYHTMYPNATVGLIPMAWGGAAISQMDKGTPFYDEIIQKALWAQKSGTLKGILWHQGESDTVTPEDAKAYKQRLAKLIEDLRHDLNSPDLPVVVGDLAEFYGMGKDHSASDRVERITLVRKSLKSVSTDLTNVGYVSTNGLKSIDEHQVHFNRASYIILGYRYFDTYWRMTDK